MKKKQIANLIMVAVIGAIAAAGIFAAGKILGWFDGPGESAVLSQPRGIVTVHREGIAYPLEDETALRKGDRIVCDAGATAVIRLEGGYLTLGGSADITVTGPEQNRFTAETSLGEVFVHAGEKVELSFGEETLAFENAAALLSVRAGSQTVNVFAGTVGEASEGQTLDWVNGTLTVGELKLGTLNAFAISQLRTANETMQLCVSNQELDALEAKRLEAIQSQLAPGEPGSLSCTISITCKTILDNWDSLDPAKRGYVPEDGVILAPVAVEFQEGETVFDVLSRVCEACGIQIEYSWTPLYDSYYIEGMSHLYEFDCGVQSGWMYQVNGWFPNYGCSSYTLTGGEVISWEYTCSGYGEDVGADAQ